MAASIECLPSIKICGQYKSKINIVQWHTSQQQARKVVCLIVDVAAAHWLRNWLILLGVR